MVTMIRDSSEAFSRAPIRASMLGDNPWQFRVQLALSHAPKLISSSTTAVSTNLKRL